MSPMDFFKKCKKSFNAITLKLIRKIIISYITVIISSVFTVVFQKDD